MANKFSLKGKDYAPGRAYLYRQPPPMPKKIIQQSKVETTVADKTPKLVESIIDALADAMEELNRTVQASASVMEKVLANTDAVKQFVARSNETGWLNTNSLQKTIQNTESVLNTIKTTIDANSTTMRNYVNQAGESMRANAIAMEKAIVRLQELQSLAVAAKDAVVSSGQVVQMNKDTMQTIKSTIGESVKNMGQMVSVMQGVKSSISNADETLKLSGHVMQLVVEKLHEINTTPQATTVVTTPSNDWKSLRVNVMSRDYRGNITELEVKKV